MLLNDYLSERSISVLKMVDVLTKKQRSHCMSQIRSKNTQPEMALRQALSSKGIRGYRIHYKLAGSPDIVFPRKKIAIFIDGCFWHRCPKCSIRIPIQNRSYWLKKIINNVRRDKLVTARLRKLGWKVIRVWEHAVRKNLGNCCLRICNIVAAKKD
jgi:DNA mismatch endonuclease, patch repair protein